jgi:hypothetical protein
VDEFLGRHRRYRGRDGAPGLRPSAHLNIRVRTGARRSFVTGMPHSIVKGSAYEPTPWRAVQRAAWEALNRA